MSLFLTSTSDLIQVITATGVSTINVQATWVDYGSGTTVTPGRTNTNISTQTTQTVVDHPGASTQRNVEFLSIYNSHASSSCAITLQHTDGTTVSILYKYTLLAGESLTFANGKFDVQRIDGKVKTSVQTGQLLRVMYLIHASGSSTYITGCETNTIKVKVLAAGGAGGGAASAAASGAAGGGASAGGYAEKVFAVSPNTGYAYTIGLGGTAGSAGNNPGGDGGASSFTVGATTVTANGGKGGNGMAAGTTGVALGGASPAVSTSGDLNLGGPPGWPGITLSAAVSVAGQGGTTYAAGAGGNARITQGTGTAAGFAGGGGAGGVCVSAGGAVAGGAGVRGMIVVEEYT